MSNILWGDIAHSNFTEIYFSRKKKNVIMTPKLEEFTVGKETTAFYLFNV